MPNVPQIGSGQLEVVFCKCFRNLKECVRNLAIFYLGWVVG